MNKLEIVSNGGIVGTDLILNGEKLRGVRKLVIEADAENSENLVKVTLTMIGVKLDVDLTDPQITYLPE